MTKPEINKQQELAQKLYEIVVSSGCNDEEIMKGLAILSSACISIINKNDVNQGRIVANNFADHIKEILIQNHNTISQTHQK